MFDLRILTNQLTRFYDFSAKTVIYVGAAGRQLMDPAIPTKQVIAVDKNAAALRTSAPAGATVVALPFEEVTHPGDVVYFEFCLHEIAVPFAALMQARRLAPDIVVFDHEPGSEWMFYANEEDEARRATEAMEKFGIRRKETHSIDQRFFSYTELVEKLSAQGPIAQERAQYLANAATIAIPMRYQLVLL